jgi:hypothetical protein
MHYIIDYGWIFCLMLCYLSGELKLCTWNVKCASNITLVLTSCKYRFENLFDAVSISTMFYHSLLCVKYIAFIGRDDCG